MITFSSLFANDLKEQGINLEKAIKGCKQITLDYSWYAKFPKEGYRYRKYIALYIGSQRIARVFLKKDGRDNSEGVEEVLAKAYESLKSAVRIPKKVKIRGSYLKGHPNQEQDLGSLR